MFVGSKRLVCHQGKDLAVAQKQRYAEERAKKTVISLRVQHTQRLAGDARSRGIGCFAARQPMTLQPWRKKRAE